MTTPYTKEEINYMTDNFIIELYKEKSPRVYPYCLIGQSIHEARKK
jgi:hypothetical protein